MYWCRNRASIPYPSDVGHPDKACDPVEEHLHCIGNRRRTIRALQSNLEGGGRTVMTFLCNSMYMKAMKAVAINVIDAIPRRFSAALRRSRGTTRTGSPVCIWL